MVPVVGDVVVRLTRPEERLRCDTLMDTHHELGIKQFAGHELRYIVEWRGQWLAVVGWHKTVQFRRLHLCANSARFLNNLALAPLLSQRPFETVSDAQTYYAGNRDEALQLPLAPA